MQRDKKEEKRLYDIEYRRKNKEKLAEKKRIYNSTARAKLLAKKRRQKPERKQYHNEYCRQPEYRKYKHLYDVAIGAMKKYGEYWEAAVILIQIERKIKKLIPKKERAYYKRNVRAIVARNSNKRLDNAINRIINGEVGAEILKFSWTQDKREILESLV
ncbi:hypothetical protein KAR91_40650 [Candidatus Pacearchaeota archaeon]|nr:hypothetical protein [Candidatus Pacearchaeota archaeon]